MWTSCAARASSPEVAAQFLPCPRIPPKWAAMGNLYYLVRKLDTPAFATLAQHPLDHWHASRPRSQLRHKPPLLLGQVPSGCVQTVL